MQSCKMIRSWQSYGTSEWFDGRPDPNHSKPVPDRFGQPVLMGVSPCTALHVNGYWQKHFASPELSWGIDYRAVFESRDGSLWFGAAVDSEADKGQRGGVLQLVSPLRDPANWTYHSSSNNGLNQSNAYGIGQSADDRIWIGGGNLYGYDGSQWQKHPDSRLQQFVNVVKSDDDLLVVGSRYYGVFLYNGKEWKNYDRSDGLSGNTVISLDIIGENCIYVATEKNICRFDGATWIPDVFPRDLNMELEGGMLLHDREGSIWINKSSRSWKRRAFSHNSSARAEEMTFNTHRYRPDRIPPETRISLFTKEVSPDGNTLLKWDGTDYFAQSAGEKLMFSYKLGDQDWSPFTKDRHVTLMNLSNGKYILQVRARDLDLNVDPTPAMVHFTVLPPIWKRAWFILLMLIFLTILSIQAFGLISKKLKLEALNKTLHQTNQDLELKNAEIRDQKEQLEAMVGKIEKLSKAKLKFFTNISHELRTPLTLISGPVQELIHKGPRLPEKARTNLYRIIERNGTRLHKLINQLLEIRKVEASSLDLHFVKVTMPEFLDNIMTMFENLSREKDIRLTLNNRCSNIEFVTDADKLEKILFNLLSNAFKYTPSGGSVTVQLDKAPFQSSHEEYLKISVADTGRGIAQEELARIFEPFYITGPATDDTGSMGVGLAFTKELVDLLQGNIKVESKTNVGTIFKVYLPCLELNSSVDKNSQTFPALNGASSKQSPAEGKRILVVEDNPDMRTFLHTVLSHHYHVELAEDGHHGAGRKPEHKTCNLIVSDVMMPGKDGFSLCEDLKSDFATSHIPGPAAYRQNIRQQQDRGI